MSITWPQPPPPDETPELAALRVPFAGLTPSQTLGQMVRTLPLTIEATQGAEGGRVIIAGLTLHAQLMADACVFLNADQVTNAQANAALAAAVEAKAKADARDALLAVLPRGLRRKILAEVGG